MKKIFTILLIVFMAVGLCSCNKKSAEEVNTLKNIYDNKFETKGYSIYDNVFVLSFIDGKGEDYLAIIKIPDDRMEAFDAIGFDSLEVIYSKLVEVFGDLPLTDKIQLKQYKPTKETIDSYKGMKISEFEAQGFYMNGFAGIDGKYKFGFENDVVDFTVELEDVKLQDYDDMDLFDVAIQDLKIKEVTFNDFTFFFVDSLIQPYLDEPEQYVPTIKGITKNSLEEINSEIGCNIKAYPNASEEQYGIDGEVGEYIFKLGERYVAIRATKNLLKQIIDNAEGEDNLQSEDGTYYTSYLQNDDSYSVRFVKNDIKYGFFIYDGNILWDEFETLSNSFINSLTE